MAGRYFSRQVRPIYQASTLQEMMMPLQLQQERHDKTLAAIESQALDFQNLGADTEEADRIRSEFTKQKSSVTDKILNEGISKDSYRDFLKVKRMRDSELNPGGTAYKMQNEYVNKLKHEDYLQKLAASGNYDPRQIEAARRASEENYKGVLEGSSYQGITPGVAVELGTMAATIGDMVRKNPSGYLTDGNGWSYDEKTGNWTNTTTGWKGTEADAITQVIKQVMGNNPKVKGYLDFNKQYGLDDRDPDQILENLAKGLGEGLATSFHTTQHDIRVGAGKTNEKLEKEIENFDEVSLPKGAVTKLDPKSFDHYNKALTKAKTTINEANVRLAQLEKQGLTESIEYKTLLENKKTQEVLIDNVENKFDLAGIKEAVDYIGNDEYVSINEKAYYKNDNAYYVGNSEFKDTSDLDPLVHNALSELDEMHIDDVMKKYFGSKPLPNVDRYGEETSERVQTKIDGWNAVKEILEGAYNKRQEEIKEHLKTNSVTIYSSPTVLKDTNKDGDVYKLNASLTDDMQGVGKTAFMKDGLQLDEWEANNGIEEGIYVDGEDQEWAINAEDTRVFATDKFDSETALPIVSVAYFGQKVKGGRRIGSTDLITQVNFVYNGENLGRWTELSKRMQTYGNPNVSTVGKRIELEYNYARMYNPVDVANLTTGEEIELDAANSRLGKSFVHENKEFTFPTIVIKKNEEGTYDMINPNTGLPYYSNLTEDVFKDGMNEIYMKYYRDTTGKE